MRDERPALDLSIVVPAYNEERRLPRSLPLILEFAARNGLRFELLVVDDGSTDETAAVAARLLDGGHGRVVAYGGNRGKGYAFRQGFLAARGSWVLLTDADLSTPIDDYERLARRADERELDVVIGSRRHGDSRIELRQGPLRRLLGAGFSRLVRRITGLPHDDTQCGFKLFRRAATLPVVRRMRIDGFAFDVELLILARQAGLRVGEAPVRWRNDERSKVRVLSDPARMLVDVIRTRWRSRGFDAPPIRLARGRSGSTAILAAGRDGGVAR